MQSAAAAIHYYLEAGRKNLIKDPGLPSQYEFVHCFQQEQDQAQIPKMSF